MSPWLIVTTGWPASASTVVGLLSGAAVHPGTGAIAAATATSAVGIAVLILRRARARPGGRSTS